jgi:hypothetical protein
MNAHPVEPIRLRCLERINETLLIRKKLRNMLLRGSEEIQSAQECKGEHEDVKRKRTLKR